MILMAKKKRVLKRAFEQSLENRKFEITLYWERTKYFFNIFSTLGGLSVLIALLAVGLDTRSPLLFLTLIIIECVGLVSAVAWVKVNLGSKYWQVNWETYVNKLGEDFIGPLFQYNIPAVGELKRYSVSKVNLRLSYYIVAVWALILLTTVGTWICILCCQCQDMGQCQTCTTCLYILVGVIMLLITCAAICCLCHTKGGDNILQSNGKIGVEGYLAEIEKRFPSTEEDEELCED